METIKEDVKIACDLTFCSLESGCYEFEELFKCKPTWLRMSVNTIFAAMEIKQKGGWFFVGKDLWYECSKELPDDAWQLEAIDFDNERKYIFYSPGA